MTDNERNTSGPKPRYGEPMKLAQTHLPHEIHALLKRRAEVAKKPMAEFLRDLIIHALR